jgi:peptidoglycan/xylan/chitin deacetylase (PgdA/CDA1 family)
VISSSIGASAREAVKSLGEKLLASGSVRALTRRRLWNKRLILSYHNVIASDTPRGDRSLHLPRPRFAQQLDFLQSAFDIVALDSILAPHEGAPRVAITFDDAYRGALIHGIEELARRGLPATVCVAPGLLGARATWWDALAAGTEGLRPEWRQFALLDCAGEDRRVRHWAAQQGLRLTVQDGEYEIASESEFLTAMAFPRMTAASHSWSHANLSRLSMERVLDELRKTEAWLQEQPLKRIPWLAYPYGIATEGIDVVREMGYAGAMLVAGGWFDASTVARALIPRLNIPATLSIEGFKARLGGVLN